MSLTKATYSMISGAQINVLDYGADPTGATDSAANIQNAIDAVVASATPGVVVIPAGTYRCDSGLTVDMTLVSIDAYGAFIDFGGMAQSEFAITIRGDGQGYAGGTYYAATNYIQGLRIKGKEGASEGAWPTPGNERNGIFIDKLTTNTMFGYEFRNCVVTNFTKAIELGDEAWGFTFRNCNFLFNFTGYYAPLTIAAGAKMLFDGCIFGNGSTAFDLQNTNASTFVQGCNVEGMQDNMFYIVAGELAVSGCHIETGNSDTACYVLRRDGAINPNVFANVSIGDSTIIVKSTRTVPIVDFSREMVLTITGGQIFADSATHSGTAIFDGGANGVGTLSILGTRLTKSVSDVVFDVAAVVEINAMWGYSIEPTKLSFVAGPATGGTSTSRSLEAYDEGTWVPTIASSSGAITTYSAVGTYVRVGDLVTVKAEITITSIGTASGFANIGGLPYNTKSGETVGSVFIVVEYTNTGATYRGVFGSGGLTGSITTFTNGNLTWADNDKLVFIASYIAE